MTDLLPIIVIAVASFFLLTQRDGGVALGAFFLQWVGIGWLVWVSASVGAGGLVALVELVAALSTSVVMALTVFRAAQPEDKTYPVAGAVRVRGMRGRGIARSGAGQGQDWILLWGVGALAGVAGYGLARVNPLEVKEGDLLAFFWVALAAVLTLTLDGARSAVKLGLGLLSLLNSAFLLMYMAGDVVPPVGVLALGAVARIGVGMLFSYIWLAAGARYETLNLNALFDSRDGTTPGVTSLAIVADGDRAAEGDLVPTTADEAPEESEDE
ncbi:MAG: hypothetical protein WCD37_18680 [Chloroflexia bacterium]